MQKTKRLLSLFLCLLMIVSVFAVDASAIQYVGGDSTIGSASSGSSDGFAIWDGDLGNQFYIVGYRFSAVDSKGNTLETTTGKTRVVDLIRFGDYKENNRIVRWGTSAYDTNRMAGDMRETRWLTTRNNKFQWAQTYKKGSGSIGVKTTTGTSANNSTMGLYYASADKREDGNTNTTKPGSNNSKPVYSVLPYTSSIKNWMKNDNNFAYVANALGFSNASASDLAGTFGADKRILIEPLIRIMFNGTYILLSVTDAAIISMPSFGENGRTSWIGDYTNRQFPQALYIDKDLGLPYNYPVDPITSTKSKGSYWTNKEIVTTGLGGAVAWVETDPPVNFNKLNIVYNVGDGSVSSNTYSVNSSGNVTKGGSLFKQVKYPYEKIDLYNKAELGITAPTGYHNTTNYKAYSYSSGGTAYIRKYGQDDNSRTSENFWKNIYYDATSDGSNSASAGWRYVKSGSSYTQTKALSKYDSDRTVYVYPIYDPNTITVVFDGNGATSGSTASQTFKYNETKALTANGYSRTGFTFLGWATSKSGNVVYTDKKSVKASTLSNKILSNESTTITLYAVWRSNYPVAKIGVRYSTALGDAKQTEYFSHKLAGLGYYGGTTVNNAVNSSGVVTSTGSLDYDFIYYEADSKKIPYVQTFNGKVDVPYTYGLTDYTAFGLSRTGNTPLKASDELGVDGSKSGSVWGYNATDYYVKDNYWYSTKELRFFNESEPLTIEGFWRTASAPVYAGNARKVSSVEFYSTGGTKLDLSECSINSQGDGATLVVTRTLPELEMSNGYTPYKWVSTFIWRKTGNNATTGKAEFSWFLDKTVRYCFKDNGSNQAVIYKLTVDYIVPEKDSGLTGATYVTDTLFGNFSLYCDKNPSYSDYTDASGDSNAYLPTFNLYAQWVNSYSRFYINYNINGGTVKNTSAGYGKTNYYAPNIDAVSVVTKNGEIVSSEIPVIPNQTTFNKSLQNYETFGLVRDGYGTNKTWRFVTKQYELNENTGVLCFIDGATKYSIHQDTVITSTQTLFNGLSDSDNQSTIMRIGYYKADGTKYSNSELRNNDTVYSNGDYCDIFALSGVSDTDKAYQIRLRLEYQSSSKKWVCTKMYQYWFEGVAKRGLTSSFDDENAIQVFRETQYGVGTGSGYEHKFAGLLPYWDGINGTHSKISGTDVYFTQNTTNAKYRESLPIFTLSATWSPNILKFVNYKYQATSSDGNYKTSESDVGVMGDVITETYSGNGIKAPEMKAPFGYRLVRERWSPKTGVDTITGISPNSTIYFKSGDNTINDNNIHITSDQNYWCGNQNYFEAENVQVDSETGATTLTLYNAVVPNILTVSYNNNGGSGTLGKQYGIHSDDITLHSSGMTKSGYELVGWNTAADGSGDEYSLGQTVNAVGLNNDIGTQDCTVTLYAVWAPLNVIPRIIYRYNSNGGDVTATSYALGTTSALVGQTGNSSNTYNFLYKDEVILREDVVADETGKGAIKCITYASAGMKKDGYVPAKTGGNNVWYSSVSSYTYNTDENKWTYVAAKYRLKENTEYEVVDFLNHIGHKLDVNGNEIGDYRVSSASVTDTTTKVTVVYPLEQNHGYALYKTIYAFECIDSVWYLSSQANYYYRGGKSFTKTATADLENLAGFTKTGSIEGFTYKCIDMDAAFANVNYLNSANVETYTFYAEWKAAYIDYYKITKSLDTATGGYTESMVKYTGQNYTMSGVTVSDKNTTAPSAGYRRVNTAWAVDKNGTVATNALVGGNKLFIKEAPENVVDGTNVYADVSYKNRTAFDVDNITINNKTTASESSAFGFSLYDVIIQNKLTVNYNANGGTGTAPATQYSKYGASVTLANNTFTKDGYEFIGWNTKADGTGTSYNAKASVTSQTLAPDIATKDCSVTLYAQWKAAYIDYYKITKSLDTATGGYTESMVKYTGQNYSISGVTVSSYNTTAPSTGYRRVNEAWAVDRNGTVATDALKGGNKLFIKKSPEKVVDGTNVYANVSYKNSTTFDVNNITINGINTASESSVFGFSLYDVIIQNKLTVNYNANGGTGTAPATQYSKYGVNVTIANNTFTRNGYEFIGWNTKADGTGTSYNAKASVTSQTLAPDIATKDCSVTLYAQWKAVNGSINVSLTRDTTSNYSVKSTEALNGYTFTLYKKNASGAYVKVTDAATNTSGKVSFTGLEYGAYKVEPKQPTTSLYITDASKEITVNSQTANSASFLLHNKGNIVVTLSYDATAWASGTTATVGLYSNSGCTSLIESKSVAVSSSASGSVTFTGLATKSVAYYLKVTTSINCHTWSTISAVAAGDIAAATNYTVAKTSKLTPAHDGTVKVSVTRGSDAYLSSTSVAGLQFAVYGVKSDNSEVKLSTITTTGSATSSTGSYAVSIENGGSYKSYVVKPVSTFADTHISIAAKGATSVDVATLRNVLHGHDFTANFEVTTDSVGSITVRVDKAAYMPDDDDLSSLTMKVTLKQGSTTIKTETVTVGDDGKVVLNNLPAGEYTVTLSGVNAPYVVESTNPQTATVTTGGNTSVVFVVGAKGTIIARNATYYYQSFLTAGNVTAIGGISLYRDSEHKTAETGVTRSLGAVNSTSYAYYAYQDTTFTKVTLSDTGKVLYVAPTNSVPDCHTVNVSTATNRDCKVSIQDILNAKNASGKHTYSVTELVLYATPCTATYNFVVHNKTDVNSGTITFKVTNNVDSTVYKSAAMTIKANTDITKSATDVSIVRMKSSSATTEYTGYAVTYSGVPAGYELVLVKGSETANMATLRSHDHTQTLEYNLVSKKDGSINVSLTRDTTGDYAVKSTEALNGYTFTAYRKNASGAFVKVKDAVTDADGKVSFTGLEYGTYKIEPTQPTGSLYITDTSKEVVINSTTPGSASFQLHNKGTVKVTVNKNPVCWFTETTVKVGLYSGDTLIEEKEVVIGNAVSFTGLKTNGTAYSVKVNNVPDCHKSTTPAAIGTTDILNATDYTVSRTITLNIDHKAKINLSVTKDNVARLSGISVGSLQFEVYGIKTADGTNVKVTTLTTDANGKATYASSLSAKLIYSGYYIVPVSTFADSEVHFNANKSETVTVDALRADKHGHDADVAFNITAAPTGSIKVTIDKEDYVPDDDDLDITVTVTVYDEDGNKIAEEIVNPSDDPVVTFDDLPIGDYTIKVSDPKDPYDIEDNEKEITVVDGDTEEVTFKVGVYGTIYVEPFSQSSVVFHDMTDFKKITGIALYSDEALSNLLYKKTFTAASYAESSVGNMYVIDKFTKIPLNEINKIYYVGYLGALPECHGLTITSSKSGDIVIDDRKVSVQDILSVKDASGKHTYTAPYEIIRVNSTHKGSVEIKVINNTGAAVSGAKFTVKNSVPNTYTSATKAIATGTNTYCTLAPVLYNKMVVSGSYVDNTDYSLVPTAPEGYQLKLVSGDMSQLTLENLRVHDHKATFTYELVKNAPTKGDIVVKVSSIVNAPSQFSAKWDNPAGKTATVMLYSGTTKVASKTVTIPAKGAAANSVTFADCAFGNYNIVITNPAKDCVYIYNSKQTSSAALAHDVNSQPVEFVMTNFKHTLNIDYDNQFSESLTSAKFVVTLTDVNGKTSSVTVSKGSMTVPACDANGKKYSYTIKMSTAPTNYTLDNKVASFEGFTVNKNGNITASFEGWYIWDFSIGAKLSSAAETTKATYGGFKKGSTVVINVPVTNKRAHQNTPAVSVEVFLDKTRINAQSVTIDANSSKTLSVSVSIPASASTGAHTITAYVNYDKYSTYGEGYLYETALTDNTATLTLDVISGDVRIVPVASNSDYYIGDTVFASFYVYNDSAVDILKANNTSIGGKVLYTKTDGTSATKTLTDITGVVVPSNIYVDNRNLVFFKFTVPSDAKPNTDIAVTATIKTGTAMNEDTSNDTAVVLKKTRLHAESNTPDPGRNLSAPSGWQASCAAPNLTRYAATSTSTTIGKSAKWSVWEENTTGKLTLHTYGATATVNAIVKVDNRCLTAAISNKDLVMKSGYALTLAVQPSVTKLNETPASMLGSFGSANAYYPEFSYVKEGGKYSALNLINDDALRATSQFTAKSATPAYAATHDMSILNTASRWELPQCTFSSFYKNGAGMARKHFTPLWWKNGNYQIVCDATDFWTPAGVIGAEAVAKTTLGGTVVISGSVYDDYYTVRG